MSVQLKGLKEVERALKGFEPAVAKRALRGAVMAGAKVIADDAEAQVPSGTGGTRPAGRKGRRGARAIVRRVRPLTAAGVQTVNITFAKARWYLKFLELGVGSHLITLRSKRMSGAANTAKSLGTPASGFFGAKVRHPGTPRRPMLRRALYAKQGQAMAALADELRTRVARIANELRGGAS